MIAHRFGSKVNFVDDMNVLVGFDLAQDCCEYARWWITDSTVAPEPHEEAPNRMAGRTDDDLLPYRFDPSTCDKRPVTKDALLYEEGGAVVFRLVAPGKPDLWLWLANTQNGYYSHGFTVAVGGTSMWGDYL